MQFKIIVSAVVLATTASALQITAPAKDSSIDFTRKNVVTWTSVNTDPSSFDIYLVDETVNPPYTKLIAQNVQTSAGSYTVNSLDVPVGQDYQINFNSDNPQNSGILAQSGQFAIVDASSATTSASFTRTTATTATSVPFNSSAARSTTTSTNASSSSSAGVTSSSTRSPSSTASGANASSTGNAASKMTVSGAVTGLFLGVFALLM